MCVDIGITMVKHKSWTRLVTAADEEWWNSVVSSRNNPIRGETESKTTGEDVIRPNPK